MKRHWIALIIIGFCLLPGSLWASGTCQAVFSEHAPNPVVIQALRDQLSPYFQEAGDKKIAAILNTIDKKTKNGKKIDLVKVSELAHSYYKTLQGPFYQRLFTNLFYSKNSEQVYKTEEFTQTLLRALREHNLLNENEANLRYKILLNKVPIGWIKSLSIQSGINAILHQSNQGWMLLPISLPPLAHPTFLKETTRNQRALIYAEKIFHSLVMIYFSTSLAWTMIDEDHRAEALEPVFENILKIETSISENKKREQDRINLQNAQQESSASFISHSQKTLNDADALIEELKQMESK